MRTKSFFGDIFYWINCITGRDIRHALGINFFRTPISPICPIIYYQKPLASFMRTEISTGTSGIGYVPMNLFVLLLNFEVLPLYTMYETKCKFFLLLVEHWTISHTIKTLSTQRCCLGGKTKKKQKENAKANVNKRFSNVISIKLNQTVTDRKLQYFISICLLRLLLS